MKVTVRCYYIPADITFDTSDIVEIVTDERSMTISFKGGVIVVDKQHYLDQIGKKDV